MLSGIDDEGLTAMKTPTGADNRTKKTDEYSTKMEGFSALIAVGINNIVC
jgi:hypothetical protein